MAKRRNPFDVVPWSAPTIYQVPNLRLAKLKAKQIAKQTGHIVDVYGVTAGGVARRLGTMTYDPGGVRLRRDGGRTGRWASERWHFTRASGAGSRAAAVGARAHRFHLAEVAAGRRRNPKAKRPKQDPRQLGLRVASRPGEIDRRELLETAIAQQLLLPVRPKANPTKARYEYAAWVGGNMTHHGTAPSQKAALAAAKKLARKLNATVDVAKLWAGGSDMIGAMYPDGRWSRL